RLVADPYRNFTSKMQSLLSPSRCIGHCGLQQSTRKANAVISVFGRQPRIGGIGYGCDVRPLRAQPEQQPPPKPVAADEELPPWVRREKERELQSKLGPTGLPWPLYLLFSIFTAIAAVGSIFEFTDRNPLFGVLPPENPLWAPILLFLAATGLPTAGFLFIKGVNGFNEEAERQDKLDGYL
ncbi:hypothetical protein Agub_g9692, partial [Astrephomene gubernaculifera]